MSTLTNDDLAIPHYDVALRALLEVNDGRLRRLRSIARLKIIAVFADSKAVVELSGTRLMVTRTENYIHGVGGTVLALTTHMLQHIKKWRNFANINDVRQSMRDGTPQWRRYVLADVHQLLIADALTELVATGTLQFMAGSRDWIVPPSFIDEYDRLLAEAWPRRARGRKRRGKVDIRCVHGKAPNVRNQPGQVQSAGRNRHGQLQ